MPGTFFNSSELDADGRQLVLTDNIRHVYYYDNSLESWDKSGVGDQSWYSELFSPNDNFDEDTINTSRWGLIGPSTRTLEHSGGLLSVGIERGEGTVSLSSDGKWRLTGDFDIRLYIDWDSYYNEYRSLTHTFLKVGYDDSNAARVTFSFNGSSGYQFSSEKTVSRDIRYFDWQENGSPTLLDAFADGAAQNFLRITRTSGVIRTYVSDGDTTTQVGSDLSDSVFTGDMYVEFGLETKEQNTNRHAFSKFYVVSGGVTTTEPFFSTIRGVRQDFPPRVVAVVDDEALSLIDEDQAKLWMRFPVGDENLLPDNIIRVSACNGVLYCATSGGLIAFDFPQDKIYRYVDSEIQIADEFISLRNAGVTFRTHLSNTGDMPDNNIHDVACRQVGGVDYIGLVHDSGVTVRRALADGVSNSTDGPAPGTLVSISDKGALYWAAYDPDTNTGEVSYFSNITALAIAGTTSFSRTDYYGTGTSLNILGEVITCFDIRTVSNSDQLVVGTTEGLSFIGQNPGVPVSKSVTYGVEGAAENPFSDPSFEEYIGLEWFPFHEGFLRRANILQDTGWSSGEGSNSLLLRYYNLPQSSYAIAGTKWGVYQDVDLTGVEKIYFDINSNQGGSTNSWTFEIAVDDTVVKSYERSDGTFIKYTDSADVLQFEGTHRVYLRGHFKEQYPSSSLPSENYFRIDNLQTAVGNPSYRPLAAGNASIKEVLLQYDSEGHKIYFSTAEGFGALDLDDHSLDYFTKLEDLVAPVTAETLSADFVRVEDEA
jgi:hypothetical protein